MALFDGRAYEEVEADTGATGQAAAIVIVASTAVAFAWSPGPLPVDAVLVTAAAGVAAWLSWAALTYLIGVHWMPEPHTRATWGELARTLAFSASPGVLLAAGVIDGIRPIVMTVVPGWMLVTMLLAVRHALDYRSLGRAVGVCLAGWGVAFAVFAAFGLWFAPVVR